MRWSGRYSDQRVIATRLRPHLTALLLLAAPLVVAGPAAASHTGTPDKDCADFAYQEDAQAYFVEHGGPAQDPDRLDGDDDGRACDLLPSRGTSSPQPANPSPTPSPVATLPPRKTMRGAVVLTVIDGDTIKVLLASGERVTVRLIGVDAPETHKANTPVECGGKQATAHMKRMALRRGIGRRVTLTTDPTQSRTDVFGRLLAYARVDTGRDLGREQIRSGWSGARVYGPTPFERLASYNAAQDAARRASRGVWGACGGTFHRPAI